MRIPVPDSLRPSPLFWALAALLLAADAVVIGLYLPYKLTWLADPLLELGRDGGYGETLGYAKTFWIGLCAAALAVRTRQPVFVALAAFFLCYLVDDAAMLHERWGVAIASGWGLPAVAGLQGPDVGELIVVASWAGPIAALGLVAYFKSGPEARRIAQAAGLGLVALAAFGVGMDVVHVVATSGPEINGLHTLLTTIEEGGEMAVQSVLAAAAIALAAAPRAVRWEGDGAAVSADLADPRPRSAADVREG